MSDVHTELSESVPESTEASPEADPATQLLQQQLELLYARIESESDTFIEKVHNELWSGFSTAWEAASTTHKDLVTHFPSSDSADGLLEWKQVVQYRRDVHRFIFLKIISSLMPSVFGKIESLLQHYFRQLRIVEPDLPILIQIPENPDLFTSHPSDSTGARFRKWVRRRRQISRALAYGFNNLVRRVTFRKPKAPAQRTQNIPFKHLASYHLAVRIPESIQPALQQFHRAFTEQLARFEHAQTSWLHTLLEAEHKLYSADNVLNGKMLWQSDETAKPAVFLDQSETQAVNSQSQHLDYSLVLEAGHWDTFKSQLKEAIHTCFDMLLYDTKRGGTILLSAAERPIPDSMHESGLDYHWRPWHEEVLSRTQMNNELLKFRDRLLSSNQGLIRNINNVCLAPVIQSYDALQESISNAREEAQELCREAKETNDLRALSQALSKVKTGLMNEFKSVLENVQVLVKTGKALEEPGQEGWEELNRYVDSISRVVSVHNPLPASPSREKIQAGRYEVRLGELIQQSVSESRTTRLSSSSASLRKAIFKAWGDLQEVQNIVDFNLTAAITELTQPEQKPDEETEEESISSVDPLSDAEKLISEALTRSNENLAELLAELQAPWKSFTQECFKQTNRYWKTIHEDLRSQDQIHTWFENAYIFSSRALSEFGSTVQRTGIRTVTGITSVAKNVRTQFSKLIQKGQSAVGVIEQSEEEWLYTLNRVSNFNSLHHSLPLIYQRLFSPNPLADADLVEGRKQDLDFISKHYDHWLKGQMGPLVLSMVEGSGRTSLMNVLHQSTFKQAKVHRIVFNKRIQDTTTWAERIAAVLDISPAKSIEHIESQLVARSRSKTPDIIILDQFEHLLLCTPGGDDVLERILIFMSRTDHLIYWVANINKHAWHYLENTIHPSFGFITAYTASTISRPDMENIILKRHHRSGLTLRFDPSIRSSTFRQLTQPRDDKSRQRDLKRIFFDRLYKHSGENIRLAILYWLQSVRYDKNEDTLHVHNIHPINFAFLDTLDLKRAFTLKTLMIHGTLTLDEHMRLFNMNQTESTFILESLLNLRIIEQTGKKGETNQQVHILPDASYRLHSLIRHPVSEYLSREHIIY